MRNKAYDGPERRIHTVYVTRNTEYHVKQGTCVAIKPRGSKPIGPAAQEAVRMRLEGSIKKGTYLPLLDPPKIGDRIYFAKGADDVLTSPVVAILRPSKTTVGEYPEE